MFLLYYALSTHACILKVKNKMVFKKFGGLEFSAPVTQKLIRVKNEAESFFAAIIDPVGSLLAAKSDPSLQK